MKTAYVMTMILLTGWGVASLAGEKATDQCNTEATEKLKACLEKADGPTGKQACKEAARRACDDTSRRTPK
jgi:hypothetical protein